MRTVLPIDCCPGLLEPAGYAYWAASSRDVLTHRARWNWRSITWISPDLRGSCPKHSGKLRSGESNMNEDENNQPQNQNAGIFNLMKKQAKESRTALQTSKRLPPTVTFTTRNELEDTTQKGIQKD